MKAEVVLYARVRIAFPDILGVDAVDCIRIAEERLVNNYPNVTPIVDGEDPEIIFGSEYDEAMVTVPAYPDGMDFRNEGGFWLPVSNGMGDERGAEAED